MTQTRDRRLLWWAVLAGSAVLLLAALVLAVSARGPGDFGQVALDEQPSAQTAPFEAAEGAGAADPYPSPSVGTGGGDTPDTVTDPGGAQARTVPLVPVESRRPAQTGAAQDSEQPTPPMGLQISTLDVDVDVVPVGVDDEGQMEIPESGMDVGWYRYGAAPGQSQGSAVLASHVDTLAEGKGVLARLGELRAGDTVAVTLDDGTVVDYEVTGRRTVPKADLDVRALFDRSGPARLSLVTCGGPWQPDRSSYRDNVIVTAEPLTPAS